MTMTVSQKLNKYWRVLATGISFVFFGLGGVVLTFIIFPVLTLCVNDKTRRKLKARKIIQQSFALFCGTMRFLGAIEYRFIGDKSFQEDENCLIIANHPSLIDIVLIVSRLPQCICLVKESIWHNFFMKGVVQAAGYIQQHNGQSLIEDCDASLKMGSVIVIFPEGTRTTLSEIPKLHRGAAQIAIKTKTDFRLLHIRVHPSILTKQKKWYHVADKKPLFEITIKSKVCISDFIKSGTLGSISVRNLSKYLEENLFLSEIH